MELEVSDDDLFIKSILEPAAAVDCGGGQCHPNEADGVAEEGDMNNNADPFFLFTDLAYDDTNPLLSPPVSSMMDPTLASPSSYSSPCRGDSSFFFSSTSSSSSTTPTSSPLSLQTTEDSSFSSSSWPSPCHQPEALQQEQQLNLEFNSWLATALPSSALEPGNATPATISPAQLGLHQHHHGLPQIIPPSPPPVASSPQHGDSDDSEDPGCMDSATGRRGRKRKRPKKSGGSSPSGPQTAVSLPREELLKLSSQELDEYAENLRKTRTLTEEEERDLRRQRRMIKNRESAQLSRTRRREHLEELQQQLHEALTENERLKLEVSVLTEENDYLKKHIDSTAVAEPDCNSNAHRESDSNCNMDGSESRLSVMGIIQDWASLGKSSTAAVVKTTQLFVILLSIGLLFNMRFIQSEHGAALGPLSSGPANLAFSPSLSGSSSYSHNPDNNVARWKHRSILQTDEDNLDQLGILYEGTNTRNKDILERDKMEADNHWHKGMPAFPMTVIDSHSNMKPTELTGEPTNKTVLMCPVFVPLQWPGEIASADAEEITFVLPASSASYLPAARRKGLLESRDSSSMVQLTCNIQGIQRTTVGSLVAS